MTLKTKKSKTTVMLEQESDLLTQLLADAAKVTILTHAFVRNQIRFRRQERIAPLTPLTPHPEEAALRYQARDLSELSKQLLAMGKTVLALHEANKGEQLDINRQIRG